MKLLFLLCPGKHRMILHTLLLIFIILKSTRCSIVFDSFSKNSVDVLDYCPETEDCPAGSHVMCMYYDRDRPMGQRCNNYIHTEIKDHMVHQILESVNDIRSSIAHGHERGKDGKFLPKGYGMMELEWDTQLATFAQVLANQCLGLRPDDCRATDKFPNPSQITSIINFRYPDWQYLKRNSTKDLNDEKLMYAIYKMFTTLHGVKKFVSEENIFTCPPLDEHTNIASRSYLKLIQGAATHIGCGLSAYTRYHPGENVAQNIYNSVQVVCNISEGPTPTESVYTTKPPTAGAGFSKCGCPKGYKETSGCLCKSVPDLISKTTIMPEVDNHPWLELMPYSKIESTLKHRQSCDSTGTCRPIMVLPVFSREEDVSAPEESHEIKYDLRYNNTERESREHPVPSEDHYNRNMYNKLIEILTTYRSKFNSPRYGSYDDQKIKRPMEREQKVPETDLNNAEECLGDDHQDLGRNDDSNYENHNYDVDFEKDYKKCLTLIDLLEHEPKNKALNDIDKEMLDGNMINTVSTNSQQTTGKNRDDIEHYFSKLKDYLKNKAKQFNTVQTSEHESDHFSMETNSLRKHNYNEKDIHQMNNYKYSKRRFGGNLENRFNHGIDDKLMDIVRSKSYNRNRINKSDSKYDLNFNNNNENVERKLRNHSDRKYDNSLDHTNNDSFDHQYDDIDDHEFNSIPASRNQETLGNYNKDFTQNEKNSLEEVEYTKPDKYDVSKHLNDIHSYRHNDVERHKISRGNRETIPQIHRNIKSFKKRKLSHLDVGPTTPNLVTSKRKNEKERFVRPNRPYRNDLLFGPGFTTQQKQRTYFANRATF